MDKNMKIAIILGTRPEIIKLSPIIRILKKNKDDFFVIHTNQHYSILMDKIFFDELNLPSPKYNLGIGSDDHGAQTGKMLIEIEKILLKEKPNIALVQGDTNTVLAGALASSKLGIAVGHVEAGLRSFDRTMPEEINRVVTDHISDYLFCPTKVAAKLCADEAIDEEKIFVVGNTIVDSVYQNLAIAKQKSKILNKLNLTPKKFILLTLHRPSNVDNKKTISGIIKGIDVIIEKYKLPVIFPIHPRTQKQLKKFKLDIPNNLILIEPVGFSDFLVLEKNSLLIITDSGGIQEEACILQIPCITLRENTERPETISVGANMLAGNKPSGIVKAAKDMLQQKINWKNPFGKGDSAKRILKILRANI